MSAWPNFEGAYIRTAAVEGRVIIEGEGLAGVTVTLTGGPGNDNYTKLTGDNGEYAFTELRPGDYQVSISGYDADDYEFASSAHDVSVELDETETVSFTGVLLRTSGISGRVSVEGMGIPDIAVTLSGAADATTMTDASGQYAFAGLAAGDYTVSIAVASAAYVFGSMSETRTVGDDDSQIVNFEGDHDTSASLSVMLFIDEASKNDMHDPGEDAFPSAAMLQALQAAGVQLPMLPVPVSLVGPAVNRMKSGALNLATGQITFSDLQAGSYQLQVGSIAALAAVPGLPAAAAALLQDFEYGGPAEGYAITIGVAETATHNVPVDITHTTVDFTVALKHGDDPGPELEGATVTLYRDAAGNTEIDSGETGADGTVAIRFARAGGTMVHAEVSADGYDVAAEGLQPVTWNPQSPMHAASNEADIVNLNVDVTVSGATVTTEHGGGDALAGWAISVMKGAAAVEEAPGMLGADGTVPFTATVGAGDLPVTYTFAVAEDQDDELDGGETYEGSDGMYMHDGLSLAGTQGAATIEVQYTSQTLKVYVYQERDQVHGYTGNVLGGDVRMSELVDLEVRQIGDNGLSRPFSSADWDAAANTEDDEMGGYTFAHLPAEADVVVLADAVDGYKLLDPYRLDTYRNINENGVMGGAFGEEGGYGHTVSLCPLTKTQPIGQDFGECGSFAVVSTHQVSGQVWKNGVRKSGTGFSTTSAADKRAAGTTVSLTPAEGKNLAGDAASFTAASSNDVETIIDERTHFDFGSMAAGVYDLGLPDGWRAMLGAVGSDTKLDGALSPLGADVQLDITPATGTLYGFVRGNDGFGLANVTVHVNGVTATTDDLGRYIVSGFDAVRKQVFVHTAREGFPNSATDSTNNDTENHPNPVPAFAANTVKPYNIDLAGANATLTVTGTITESGTAAPIKGVQIKVDGAAPLNAATSGGSKGKLVTGDDGTYTAIIPAKVHRQPQLHNGGEERLCLHTRVIPRPRPSRDERNRQLHRLQGCHDFGQGGRCGWRTHERRYGQGARRCSTRPNQSSRGFRNNHGDWDLQSRCGLGHLHDPSRGRGRRS